MHHGALGAMRSAGRLGVPVFLAHYARRSPLDRSCYNCGSLVLPLDRGASGTLEVLLEFGSQHRAAVLLAVDDASAMFVEDHRGALADAFLLPQQRSGLARALADKRRMHQLCREHGVATALTTYPQSEADVLEYATAAAFPVVAKRIDASLPIDTPAPNVIVARGREDLLAACRRMGSAQAANLMLQEYIPGAPEANWMFNGYFDKHSECRVSFTGVKVRQAPAAAGATTLGVCRANPLLARSTERFMQAIGYRGIVDIDYRLDARDGQYKLLDVNPRIGSSFRLFVGMNGVDVLQAMYFDLTGRGAPAAAQQEGRRWLVEPQDLQSSLTYVKHGDLTVRDWLSSLRHIDEAAWWAGDDPRPFLAVARWLSVNRALRPLRNGSSRLRAGKRLRLQHERSRRHPLRKERRR